MSLFRQAVFSFSASRLADLPPPERAEIAFAGRSNAGKSSAINALVGTTRLAFVSKTPGRTQLLNFFRLASGDFIVDLPGYGYARVPDAVRREWRGMLEGYLTRRPSLVGLVLIMDARHPLTQLDRQMIEWFAPTGRPMHVLLTKADKLTRSAADSTLDAVRKALAAFGAQASVQLFSSLKKVGIEEAEAALGDWLRAEPKEKPPAKGEKTGG